MGIFQAAGVVQPQVPLGSSGLVGLMHPASLTCCLQSTWQEIELGLCEGSDVCRSHCKGNKTKRSRVWLCLTNWAVLAEI